MRYLLLALLTGCASPAYYYASFGAGKMKAHDWECIDGVLGVTRLGLTYEINDDQQLDLEAEHESMIDCGYPSNNRVESDKDSIGVHYKYIWN